MTFKTCMEYFPMNDTWVGRYYQDGSFVTPRPLSEKAAKAMSLFWEDDSCVAFIIYDPQKREFQQWWFGFRPVEGYINDTGDSDDFYPAVNISDFAWEKVDYEYGFDTVSAPDSDLAVELGWPLEEIKDKKWRREQMAYMFDIELYNAGFIFTSLEALNKFLKENFSTKK